MTRFTWMPFPFCLHQWTLSISADKDAVNEMYDDGIQNQGHRSNLWFTGDVSSWWTVWRVWAPAVTLLIPHSLYLFSRSVMTAFFFTLLHLHVLISLHLSILTFTPPSLSYTALWTQTVKPTKPVRRKMFNLQADLIRTIKADKRYFIKQKHHNSRPHDSCYISNIPISALTDEQIINH